MATIWIVSILWMIIYFAAIPKENKRKLSAAVKEFSVDYSWPLFKVWAMWVVLICSFAPLLSVLLFICDMIYPFIKKA